MAAVGEGAVVPQLPPAHAFEEAAQQVHAIPVLRSPAASLGASDLLHSSPQLVGHRRPRPPRCGTARLILAAVPPDPAVVERVHEDHPYPRGGETGLRLELRRADVAEGISLEQADSDGHALGIDLEGVRRLRQASEAEGCMATGIAFLVELRCIALGDALRQAAAVLLRPGRLGDQLVQVRTTDRVISPADVERLATLAGARLRPAFVAPGAPTH
jgi:hypothetical protein